MTTFTFGTCTVLLEKHNYRTRVWNTDPAAADRYLGSIFKSPFTAEWFAGYSDRQTAPVRSPPMSTRRAAAKWLVQFHSL